MAAASIPVFWYMLFDEGSLTLGPEPETETSGKPYLHLSTPTAAGLARAESRWPAVSRLVGRQLSALFQTWGSFVRDRADAYIHCETAEWCWLHQSHDEFEAELRTCLAAFDHVPERTETGIAWNPQWATLLAQAHVGRHRGGLRPLGNLSYCGFGYQHDVPWSEESDIVCGVMSDKVQGEPAFGNRPEDLLHYLEFEQGPAAETRLLKCACGNQAFRLRYSPGNGARRICARCGVPSFVLGSKQYWDNAEHTAWACQGCGGAEANVGIGFELNGAETRTAFVSIGQRCVQCGRLGCCVCWDDLDSFDCIDSDGACDRADELSDEGYSLAGDEQYADALTRYRAAWDALPEPREKQEPAGRILTGIADVHHDLHQWEECRRAAEDALRYGQNADDLNLRLRLGQALFELGETDAAGESLVPVYNAWGLGPFEGENRKYLEAVRIGWSRHRKGELIYSAKRSP